jgi:Ca2+-binding RTX toxin-like protein
MVTRFGTNGDDILRGGRENEIFSGQGGEDIINAGAGKDSLKGGAGEDILNGGAGADNLNGGAGKDVFEGGAGKDTLTGNAGADKFVFSSSSEGIDTISNFSDEDKIVIRKESFGATSTEQFSYNNDTGALLFDVSSTDDLEPVQIASLPRNLGSTFNLEDDITLSTRNSGSGNIDDSNNNDIINVENRDLDGGVIYADPQTVDI